MSSTFSPGVEVEIDALEDFVPEGDELFLREFRLLEFSVQRKFNRAGHHQLLARIFRDRAADFAFVESDVVELPLDGAQAKR